MLSSHSKYSNPSDAINQQNQLTFSNPRNFSFYGNLFRYCSVFDLLSKSRCSFISLSDKLLGPRYLFSRFFQFMSASGYVPSPVMVISATGGGLLFGDPELNPPIFINLSMNPFSSFAGVPPIIVFGMRYPLSIMAPPKLP